MKRAAIYVRVSKRDMNLENQMPSLRRMAEMRELEVVAVYEDKMSGAKKSRPGIDALKAAAHAGDFDYVLVWAIDRLGRSMIGVMETILGFDRIGVTVVSKQECWLDTQGPVRSLLISIFSWVAEQERLRIMDRSAEGLATARAKGIKVGRPNKPIDLDAAVKMRAAGKSLRQVAKHFEVSVSTMHRALQDPDVPNSVRTIDRRKAS